MNNKKVLQSTFQAMAFTIHTYSNSHTYTHMYTHTHAHAHTHPWACTRTCTCTHTHPHTPTHMILNNASAFRGVVQKGTLWTCKVRAFKIDAAIWNAFLKCGYGMSPPQPGRLLLRIIWFLPKMRKASSKERWVRTHVSFRESHWTLSTYLPHSRLGLTRSHLGLLHLCLSQNSEPATEKVSESRHQF